MRLCDFLLTTKLDLKILKIRFLSKNYLSTEKYFYWRNCYRSHSCIVISKWASTVSVNNLIYWTLLFIILALCIASFSFTFLPILRSFLYKDHDIYTELIYDPKQLKIFRQ